MKLKPKSQTATLYICKFEKRKKNHISLYSLASLQKKRKL